MAEGVGESWTNNFLNVESAYYVLKLLAFDIIHCNRQTSDYPWAMRKFECTGLKMTARVSHNHSETSTGCDLYFNIK